MNKALVMDKTVPTPSQLPVIDFTNITPSLATSNELAVAIVESVLGGYINPLDLPVKKKCIEEALDAAMKNTGVKSLLIEEILKHGKSASHLGAKLEVIEAGVQYDFSMCGDTEFEYLEAGLLSISNQLKDRKEFLKNIPKEGLIVTDRLTGEVVTIYPPVKTSTTTIKTTMK